MSNILIVDDRSINREVLSVLLDEKNYKVYEAQDGLEALELIKNQIPDLIIADIAMPRMDGVSLVKELLSNSKYSKIPIIFYSAADRTTETEQLSKASNVKFVLSKPCQPEIILQCVENALLRPETKNAIRVDSVLDHADLFHRGKEKIDNINLRLTNLIEIGLDMSQEYDLDKLNYIMCKGGRQFLNACYAGIIMFDQNNSGQYKNFYIDQKNSIKVHVAEISNLSDSIRNIFFTENVFCLYSPIIDLGEIDLTNISLPISNLLCLPIKTARRCYGKVYFINKFSTQLFTLSDQRFMMTLADKFAINYENLTLYKKIEQHTKELEQEISQRKTTENFLQEVTERLHLTLEASRVGTWSWHMKTNRLEWDKYADLLFGITSESEPFTGTLQAFLDRILLEDRQKVHAGLLAIGKGDSPQPIEFRVIWPDDSIHHLLMRGKLDYAKEEYSDRVLGVYLDITEHVQAEEKLRLYRKKMAEVGRSSSLGEMASSLAHEINQPLAAIAAYVKGCIKRMEKEKNQINPEFIEILQETALQAERAGEIIHRIKSFLRKGELFYEEMDINHLLDEVINIMQLEVQLYPVNINFVKNNSLPSIDIDKIQIQQVILNLLRNAMEAMQAVHTQDPKIEIEIDQMNASRISIAVTDNGPGFSQHVANNLFEPYFSTKTQGMGLGLAICRSIIEAHSGQLTGEALAEGGSRFQFDLPIKKAS